MENIKNITPDVLIVGYGPVGATIANLLARKGIKTLIIDRAQSIYMAPRAIALDNEALRILQSVEVNDKFEKVIIEKVRMTSSIFSDFWTIKVNGTIDEHPKLVTFVQPDLEKALRENISNSDSIEIGCGISLIDFEDQGNQINAQLQNDDGELITVSCKLLIGADGANSTVRKLIGLEPKGDLFEEDWLIVDVQGIEKNIDHIEFLCNPKRPGPHMVAPGNRTRWEFMLHPGESPELMQTEQCVRELIGKWIDSEKNVRIERKAVYRFSARSCDSYQINNVLLAGDAAHVTPPFAGQGLVSGLRDAYNLAWKIDLYIKGKSNLSILKSYDEERRPHAIKMIKLAKLMGKLIMPKSYFTAFLLHGFLKILHLIRPVRHFLENFGPKPKNNFSSGLFLKQKGKFIGGESFPQFKLSDSAGKHILSDDLIGYEFCILIFNGVIDKALNSQNLQDVAKYSIKIVEIEKLELKIVDPPPSTLNSAQPYFVLLRPDKVIVSSGPINKLDSILSQSLKIFMP